MTLQYDGTHFCGWQRQNNGPTIQSTLEEQMQIVLQHKVSLCGSGRTDAGVHALAQIAHFDFEKKIDPYVFLHRLNSLLPKAVRATQLEECDQDFHARYSAKKKIYRYFISTTPVASPFSSPYRLHVRTVLDREAIDRACPILIGTHDFAAFANQTHDDRQGGSTVRTLYNVSRIEDDEGFYLEYEGNGFLYKMVRNLTGALLALGGGQLDIKGLKALLNDKDRTKAPAAAPPHPLFLTSVIYN